MRWLKFFRKDEAVSPQWLKEQKVRESRVTFHGVSISWPINKFVNEHPDFQTRKLRRRA